MGSNSLASSPGGWQGFLRALRRAWVHCARMFFRKKKGPEAPAAAPVAPRPIAADRNDTSTQFLTGDGNVDRRSVDVLLAAIARVSQSRDLEPLLNYIVDTSIEITGAERGFLLLEKPGGELYVRVSRARGGQAVSGPIRFSTSVVKGVLDKQEPMRATVTSDSEALELGTSV